MPRLPGDPAPACPLDRGRATARIEWSRARGSRAGTNIMRSIYHTSIA
jgi:hypothetical protein